ncbi:uncharacterized protein DNG_04247 [Cephalotrichum gorgonifer]|uniref:DUF2306 domain-containing protein n=1 Tax=Cephalotrichum gorgonifer TaxID=2041049 RepID=A0AAE8SUC8_9PEZI|nr:uncharacterized protein DNG_04247 [Cephalotrichum gorgonifer]
MATAQRPAAAASGAVPRRGLHHKLGFTTATRFWLFVLFATPMIYFSVRRLDYIDIDSAFCGGPNHAIQGECYWYSQPGMDRMGMMLHLGAILPAGILACVQFVPAVRRRFIALHMINGYIVVTLSVLGTIGVLMFTPHAMGGSRMTQAISVLVCTMFLVALFKAQLGIKRGRIDQHRAWMLRAWFYAGAIITMRPILILVAWLSSKTPTYDAFPCKVVEYILSGDQAELLARFPSCARYVSGEDLEEWTVVKANFPVGDDVGSAAALRIGFAVGGALAIAIHAIGIEAYLHATAAENERLKKISVHKRAATGRAKSQTGSKDTKASPSVPSPRSEKGQNDQGGSAVLF